MTKHEFHNALRILLNIDMDEFVAAGCDADQWPAFRGNPHMWFIRASDRDAERVWLLIAGRNALGLKEAK